jgi:hypothetical protein
MSAGSIEPCPWSLVVIHWIDAFDSSNGWISLSDYHPQQADIVTVGYLYPDCLEGYVTLTGSYMADELPKMENVGMLTHIPCSMVQKIVVLEQPKL